MFRLSQLLTSAENIPAVGRKLHGRKTVAPIVIWNLTRACNLECVHCYASSQPRQFNGELTTDQALRVVEDLKHAGVRTLIFSGGEPLLRHDIMTLAERAHDLGISITLSSNGTMIGEAEAAMLCSAGFAYVGVSLDGIGATHDRFRGEAGAYDRALAGLLRLKEKGMRVGVRFTITKMNSDDLPGIFDLAARHEIDKLYLSHLVYSGRGDASRFEDVPPSETRRVMEFVLEKAEEYHKSGSGPQIVTGNNEADIAFFILRLMEKDPTAATRLLPALESAGGNSAGIGVANIDSQGMVHPDPLLSFIRLGSVTEKPFGDIWSQRENPALRRLRWRPRKLNGRCGECAWLNICGGSNRARALRLTGDLWGSDPACYLTDEEIQIEVARAI